MQRLKSVMFLTLVGMVLVVVASVDTMAQGQYTVPPIPKEDWKPGTGLNASGNDEFKMVFAAPTMSQAVALDITGIYLMERFGQRALESAKNPAAASYVLYSGGEGRLEEGAVKEVPTWIVKYAEVKYGEGLSFGDHALYCWGPELQQLVGEMTGGRIFCPTVAVYAFVSAHNQVVYMLHTQTSFLVRLPDGNVVPAIDVLCSEPDAPLPPFCDYS
ncbi:MAG: hypothetical protein HY532_07905 [Chloroflexi bacterium]|nr:hypothetical protein [Chloroflexota bacterium]